MQNHRFGRMVLWIGWEKFANGTRTIIIAVSQPTTTLLAENDVFLDCAFISSIKIQSSNRNLTNKREKTNIKIHL